MIAILVASGGSRLWQERRVDQIMDQARFSPFPLNEIPTVIGSWKGRPTTLDPEVIRISGSTDHVTRHYVDQQTGVGLDVVILYGPASEMFFHIPEVCYPAAGYEALPGVFERLISRERGAATVPFRSLAFTKGESGLADSQEVYYTLHYDGRWTTASTSHKASRRTPGMYRIQVSRPISVRERRDIDNPCEPFLKTLVGEIEARMAPTRLETTASR